MCILDSSGFQTLVKCLHCRWILGITDSPFTFGYGIFPRYIACFWSIDNENYKTNRTGLSIHVTGNGFQTVFYQPVWKKRVFIAGIQPGNTYTLTAHFINTAFPAFIGVRQERVIGLIETTPNPPQCNFSRFDFPMRSEYWMYFFSRHFRHNCVASAATSRKEHSCLLAHWITRAFWICSRLRILLGEWALWRRSHLQTVYLYQKTSLRWSGYIDSRCSSYQW